MMSTSGIAARASMPERVTPTVFVAEPTPGIDAPFRVSALRSVKPSGLFSRHLIDPTTRQAAEFGAGEALQTHCDARSSYLIASGLTGEPTAWVNSIGGPANRNS